MTQLGQDGCSVGREAAESSWVLFWGDLLKVKGFVAVWREGEEQKVGRKEYRSKEPFSCLEERQISWD